MSKKDAKVCVRVARGGRSKAAETVTCVVMEATGDYWKPFYYLLEDLDGVECCW